jgi:predicted enzyme related to lactoylglutathione lyase
VWESEGNFPNYAIFYVLVQDVAATVERGRELGAKILMEPVSDSAGFTFARLEDTAGNHFGVFSVAAP